MLQRKEKVLNRRMHQRRNQSESEVPKKVEEAERRRRTLKRGESLEASWSLVYWTALVSIINEHMVVAELTKLASSKIISPDYFHF